MFIDLRDRGRGREGGREREEKYERKNIDRLLPI